MTHQSSHQQQSSVAAKQPNFFRNFELRTAGFLLLLFLVGCSLFIGWLNSAAAILCFAPLLLHFAAGWMDGSPWK